MTDIVAGPGDRATGLTGVNIPIFLLTGGFIVLFCVLALVSLDTLSAIVDAGFAWSAKFFGLYWQLLLLATFLMGLVIAALPGGKAIMGGNWWNFFQSSFGPADRRGTSDPASVVQ